MRFSSAGAALRWYAGGARSLDTAILTAIAVARALEAAGPDEHRLTAHLLRGHRLAATDTRLRVAIQAFETQLLAQDLLCRGGHHETR